MQKHKIFACLIAMCFGAIILRWKSVKLLETPLECKHVPLQTLPCGRFSVVQLACQFNWPRSPLYCQEEEDIFLVTSKHQNIMRFRMPNRLFICYTPLISSTSQFSECFFTNIFQLTLA